MGSKKGIALVIVCSVLGALLGFITLLCFSGFLSPDLEAFRNYLVLEEPSQMSQNERAAVDYLLANNIVSSPQNLLDSVVSFYTVVIELLFAVIGLVVAATVFYVKATGEEKAKEMVKSSVDSKFQETDFRNSVADLVKTVSEPEVTKLRQEIYELDVQDIKASTLFDALEMIEKLSVESSNSSDEIGSLRKQLEHVTQRLASLDDSEALGDEVIPLNDEEVDNGDS